MSSNLKVNSLVPATGTAIGIGTTGGTIDFRCPATFGGNVTIGGTLTYDEVINIDSIGIVTARSGLKVTGGQLDVGSNIKAGNSGVVTATTFVGALTGNVTGNVSGSSGSATGNAGGLTGTPNISCGTIAGSTGTFTGDVDIADKIVHTGDTDTAIRFPSSNQISFETAGAEGVRIDGGGRLLVGTTVARTFGGSVYAHLQLEGTTQQGSQFTVTRNTNDTYAPNISLVKTRGTSDGAVTTVQDNDILGTIQFRGADGSDVYAVAADINAEVDGSPSDGTDMPGALRFGTTAEGAASPTERLRIDSSGNVGINDTTPSEKLDVGGAIQASGGYKTAGHPILAYASFTDIGSDNYATRVGSTGTSTLRHTQIYGGGSHIATFDGANIRLGINETSPDDRIEIRTTAHGQGVTIKSTGNTSNALTFDANRGTQGVIGVVYGRWNGTTVAQMNFVSGDDGTDKNDGYITFGTESAASNGNVNATERLRIDANGKIRTNGATDTGHQGMVYIQGLSDPTASEQKSNLTVRGEGGNGFACGTYEATGNYGSWIQAGYVPNFLGSSPSAVYPLILNPNGAPVCVGNYNDASTNDGGVLRVQSQHGTNFYNDCTLSLEHYNHSNAREQKWHFISASNQGTEAKSNSKFRQHAVPYTTDSTFQTFTDQIVYAHTVGFNEYSWYKFNTRASSSPDRGGSARIAITWSTRHAAGTGYGEYSFAWRDEHNTSRVDCFLRKQHFMSYVGGTYYGWTSNPEVVVYSCTGGGSGAGFYLRLRGHGRHNSQTYDMGTIHNFHIIHNDNNAGGNNSFFEFVSNNSGGPNDASSVLSFN